MIDWEMILAVLIFIAALSPVAIYARQGRLALFAVLSLVFMLFVFEIACRPTHKPQTIQEGLPQQITADGFVTSNSCRKCHPSAYASWDASYHQSMTQLATPQSVVAPFDGVQMTFEGRTYQFSRRGDEYWVRMADPDWEADLVLQGIDLNDVSVPSERIVDRRVVMTTGSHHNQVFWTASNSGRGLFQLPCEYRIAEERWIPTGDASLLPPDHSRGISHWNTNCIQCHTVSGNPGRTTLGGRPVVFSEVAELGIACEACHGPGERHVERHGVPWNRFKQWLSNKSDPTIVNPARLSPKVSSQICGRCHSAFLDVDPIDYLSNGERYQPGDDLSKTHRLVRFDSPTEKRMAEQGYSPYWKDGTVRVAGREYLGLIVSPCHQRGEMSCLSCHSMHHSDPNDQLAAGMQGNQACLQCHTAMRDAIAEHTHHKRNSSGSQCYNCHMPHTSYGLLNAIRSHRIDNPSVESSLRTGRPNACNLCHLNQSLSWSAKYLSEWYGTPPVAMDDDNRQIAASLLWLLRGDAAQRTVTAWSMGWKPAQQASGTDWMAPFLAILLDDPYSATRYVASRSLRHLPGFEDLQYDFIGSADKRSDAKRHVIEVWNRDRQKVSRGIFPQILLDSDGSLRQAEIERLLRDRDHSPVNIQE